MILFEKDFPSSFCMETLIDDFCAMGGFVSKGYIEELFWCENPNHIAIFNIETSTETITWTSGLIYKKVVEKDEINIYIMFIATKYKFRGLGYASLLLKEFTNHFANEAKFKKINIILDGIFESVTFYEHFGFKWDDKTKKYDDIFDINDHNRNEHYIMILTLNKN